MLNMWKITDRNKNIPFANEELESILQDERFYDLFGDENNGSVIDSDNESIDSHDSNSVTEVTNNDRNDEENSDDAFLDLESAIEDLEDDDRQIDLIIIPPRPDYETEMDDTDEDNIQSDVLPADVPGKIEIFTNDLEYDSDYNIPLARFQTINSNGQTNRRKIGELQPKWTKHNIANDKITRSLSIPGAILLISETLEEITHITIAYYFRHTCFKDISCTPNKDNDNLPLARLMQYPTDDKITLTQLAAQLLSSSESRIEIEKHILAEVEFNQCKIKEKKNFKYHHYVRLLKL
ncbi:hypothetical protein FQA39_LY03359 [Lamprigera yunnana]|nr:hypothetical protein FQA39_LY03359 [Lamprigera yunnana]